MRVATILIVNAAGREVRINASDLPAWRAKGFRLPDEVAPAPPAEDEDPESQELPSTAGNRRGRGKG